MLMIEDEYEICLAPKNITDISINQAAHMHSVSMDTIRRAIHNRQINGVYKVKDKIGLRYLFPQDSAKKLWRIADSINSHNEEILEINQLRKEINYLKQIINAIVNLEDK